MSFTERYGEELYNLKKLAKKGLVIFTLLLIIGGTIKNVPAGHVGVVFNKLTGGIKTEEFNNGEEGMWFGIPFFQTIKNIPTTVQSISLGEVLWATDINGLPFGWENSIRYKIVSSQAAELIKTKGLNYELIILSIFKSEANKLFSSYSQENISLNNSFLSQKIKEEVQKQIDLESGDLLNPGYITMLAVDLKEIRYSDEVWNHILAKEKRKNEAEQQLHTIQTSKLAFESMIAETEAKQKIMETESQTTTNIEKQKVDLVAYTFQKEVETKAEAIRKLADAYREVPAEYLIAKAYESIKPTDKIIIGFDSLTDTSKLITISYKDLIDYLNQTKVVNQEEVVNQENVQQ